MDFFYHSWSSALAQGVELTYSFIDPATTDFSRIYQQDTTVPISDALKQMVRKSLALIEEVTLISFKEVDDNSTSHGVIQIGASIPDESLTAYAWLRGA